MTIVDRLILGAILAHLASGRRVSPEMLAILRCAPRTLAGCPGVAS